MDTEKRERIDLGNFMDASRPELAETTFTDYQPGNGPEKPADVFLKEKEERKSGPFVKFMNLNDDGKDHTFDEAKAKPAVVIGW